MKKFGPIWTLPRCVQMKQADFGLTFSSGLTTGTRAQMHQLQGDLHQLLKYAWMGQPNSDVHY